MKKYASVEAATTYEAEQGAVVFFPSVLKDVEGKQITTARSWQREERRVEYNVIKIVINHLPTAL